jgi:hypothetical protein
VVASHQVRSPGLATRISHPPSLDCALTQRNIGATLFDQKSNVKAYLSLIWENGGQEGFSMICWLSPGEHRCFLTAEVQVQRVIPDEADPSVDLMRGRDHTFEGDRIPQR